MLPATRKSRKKFGWGIYPGSARFWKFLDPPVKPLRYRILGASMITIKGTVDHRCDQLDATIVGCSHGNDAGRSSTPVESLQLDSRWLVFRAVCRPWLCLTRRHSRQLSERLGRSFGTESKPQSATDDHSRPANVSVDRFAPPLHITYATSYT